ncbi:MAG: hypothetical protein Fues2KO_23620 [Fuerstiella sp.]
MPGAALAVGRFRADRKSTFSIARADNRRLNDAQGSIKVGDLNLSFAAPLTRQQEYICGSKNSDRFAVCDGVRSGG